MQRARDPAAWWIILGDIARLISLVCRPLTTPFPFTTATLPASFLKRSARGPRNKPNAPLHTTGNSTINWTREWTAVVPASFAFGICSPFIVTFVYVRE